jgi:hypothetical protein
MTTTWRSEQRTTIPRRREITVVLFGARFTLSWYSAPPGTTYRKTTRYSRMSALIAQAKQATARRLYIALELAQRQWRLALTRPTR